MKVISKIVVLSFVFIYNICKAQNIIGINNVPQLTPQQMLKEYDTLTNYIKQISPIVYYNKEVRGINFDKHIKKLRREITPKTTLAEYLNIVYRTINVAQDNHTSLLTEYYLKNYVQKYWIPSGIKVIGHDSLAVNYAKYYDNYFNETFKNKLNLELVYTNGEYYNLLPFVYKNKQFPSEMKLIKCNGKNIHQFVVTMTELVSALKWDRIHNRSYYEDFYKSPFIYKNDTLNLIFIDKDHIKHTLNISIKDNVSFLETKKNKFGYNDNIKVISHYFDKERIFYVRLPIMEEALGDTISLQLKSIIDKNTVDAIVLDIRGNAGGSDNTYTNFLKKIIKKPLEANLVLGRNFTPINCEYNEITKDTIEKYPHLSLNLDRIPTLKGVKMFYIKMPKYNYATPDSVQYSFNGKIYILQDRFIYSSASNLSNLAYNSEQLISIGENPNLLGGLQTNPIAICLPYSKIFLRIEPQIDFTNIQTKADIFQNNIEHLINYPIDFLHLRAITSENIFGKDFLYTKDPMFRKVLELERID